MEAKAKKLTLDKYLEQIRAKVPAPTEAAIQKVYEANLDKIGGRSLAEVRPQIVAMLRDEPEQKAMAAVFQTLAVKYKFIPGKNVNALNLRPADVLATIAGKPILVRSYEEQNRVLLYEAKAKVFDAVKESLNEMIFNALIAVEAKSLNMQISDLIAREVSDKMREYSISERYELETALRKQLFVKYKTQILLKEPAPLVLTIAVENAPFRGSQSAPVTVVMFSDFQCSACAATHPVLQKVVAEYPTDKIRLVVRNYPLTRIHANAFQAAVAANAANAQGKFFEYTEILYRSQDALDIESLKKYASEAGLNPSQFEIDLQSAKLADAVRKDMADGRTYGITSTPTIYVNGVKVRVNTADGFREAIDKALKK
jgi:protein-disulfide isomerase